MNYRRDYTFGATYFFTVVTFSRRKIFDDPEAVARLRAAFSGEMTRRPFYIDAIVIMPDHLHTIWTLPEEDRDYSIRWRNIKRSLTTTTLSEQRPVVFGSRKRKQEQAIWQRRFWEHRIRDENDFNNHVDYIHYNPVKHGVRSLIPLIGRLVACIVIFAMALSALIVGLILLFYQIRLVMNKAVLVSSMLGCEKDATQPTTAL